MKRVGNLFMKIADYSNLCRAHLNARKGKAYYTEVQEVDRNVDFYIRELQLMILSKKFTTSKYEVFKISEPKERMISKLPYFPDRIVHHAIMQVLQPIWDKTCIYDSYAAIPGKGIHAGYYRLKKFLRDRNNTKYCLKFDVQKFYPSVNHDILLDEVKRKIKCRDTLWLLEDIIRSVEGDKGLPIGNYLSQYLSNIYLNHFDHWIKEKLNCEYYIRYCDDAIILHKDKAFLRDRLSDIEEYLWFNLKLILNNKTQIFPIESRGIDFLGYRTYPEFSLLRKSSKKKFKQKIKKIEESWQAMRSMHVLCSVMSYLGWLIHCNSFNLLEKYIYKNQNILDILEVARMDLNLKRNPVKKFYNKNTR